MEAPRTNRDIIAAWSETAVALDVELTDSAGYYDEALLSGFRENPRKALLYFGFEEKNAAMSASLDFLHGICRKFIASLSRDPDIEFTRAAPPPDKDELRNLLLAAPFVIGMEHISVEWLETLWNDLSAAFETELADFGETVADFLKAHDTTINVAGRVFFHLVENKTGDQPFAFMATYSTAKTGEKNAKKKAVHLPLKNALMEYKNRQAPLLNLLATVSRAAEASDFISELVESGELFSPLKFTPEEAYTFLKEIPLYEKCGIVCRIPDWWKKKTSTAKLTLSLGGRAPSQLGMEALVRFDPELCFGDVSVTKEELQALLDQTAGLSFLKGRWVEVDPEKLRAVLDAYEKADALGDLTLTEAMRLQLGLGGNAVVGPEMGVEIRNGEWIESIRGRLLNPKSIENLDAGDGFRATLRPYQQTGFDWLATMRSLGFGALLADDMGLGKTVQILALLEYLRKNSEFRALLVIPASLIGNWVKEIEKFTPDLTCRVLHAQNTTFDPGEASLFITTYGMAARLESLKAHRWDVVILDEAQAIKNPATKQAKTIKQIPSRFRIAMTGTPVENRLSDLWSLFDFLNAGLLGTPKEFSLFAKRMRDDASYAKLRSTIAPFILRRLKTDKSIIADLPDRIEMKAFAGLAKKQVVLYNGLVKELEHRLPDAEGIERKGVVLAAILKFKQICNHPDQYLGQAAFDPGQSGKFEKLAEICETIREKRERLLVFTQFREMTEPLAEYLETLFGREGLVLHGGTQVKKRTELVDRFNGEDYVPFMVLSLKAGGVGLNLTGANHVVHFDRWWNPAVENQATDRAFRIGQKKNVVVHKFVTTGTIEEKIDAMIEEKQNLASELLAGGESWITEMGNDELLKLFRLT